MKWMEIRRNIEKPRITTKAFRIYFKSKWYNFCIGKDNVNDIYIMKRYNFQKDEIDINDNSVENVNMNAIFFILFFLKFDLTKLYLTLCIHDSLLNQWSDSRSNAFLAVLLEILDKKWFWICTTDCLKKNATQILYSNAFQYFCLNVNTYSINWL